MNDADKKELKEGYVNLKEFFEELWKEREKFLDFRFRAAQATFAESKSVVEIAKNELKREHERRFEELNNLRREYTQDREDDRSLFARNDVINPQIKELNDWRRSVDKKLAGWSAAIIVIVLIIEVVIKFWR